ncbi:Wobble nucleotide-excising tRNase [Acetomicrobium thermoterrenum DSM 13490]|jgi:wobble nucleotide-excising tRNase|uniref:Wobble nucleotide-excising tRNase n=1 Tax=Acetomicrobium thermoterrenum DSM 13490 TaxID=1120987 RepID=A0A1H3FUJ3_9BACT|nr:AAA family ATPase [Acetomicrobium thermoterrenum]SDX94477.1 Wobble nucleotide-excising tRNase [Acetomicrobium thermoterrenum DSM 13490]
MIKRIEVISQFGIFCDFRWNDNLPEFAKLNLIYGWNYSGKTTLSRIFQALEHKKLSTEYSEARFRLLTEGGSQVSSDDLSKSPAVRVFNRDYVAANFSGDYSAPSIFIVGEQNIALRKRLEQLTKRRTCVEGIASGLSEKQKAITNELDKLGTDEARDIRNLLGDPRFERPQLKQRIEDVRHNPAMYIMTDQRESELLSTLKSADQFYSVSTVTDKLPNFASLAREVNELLNQTASQRAIERLKQNREVESWVRQGLSLHKDASTCEFCGGTVTTARLEELRGHFSEEYEDLVKKIEETIRHINANSLNPTVPDEMRILPEFRQSFSQTTSQLRDWIQWATALREQLIHVLKQKQGAIEKQLKWAGDLGPAAQGQQLIETLNQIIEQHNRTISTIDKAKEEAKTALERHYAARHILENEIEQKKTEMDMISKRLGCAKEILRRIDSQIQEIEQRIQESSVGATKLNSLLKYLLPGNNIEVVSVDDAQFQFHRHGRVATHLSDGEKTAVTFAYFLTSLEAKGATLSDTIVFVDDPVSSLDSNHIYAVYALLAEQLENSRQLFVSTHNAELFNLLKSKWLDERNGGRDKKDTRAYYLRRSVSAVGGPQAELLDLPTLLRQFKSEYEFIFSQLYKFAHNKYPSLHEAFTVPNLLRKFLEAYLGFRKPSVRSWSKKLELLLDSPEARREIQALADDASHLQSLDKSLQHPDFVPNAQRCVKMVLDALERKDSDHYQSLCEVIKEAAT